LFDGCQFLFNPCQPRKTAVISTAILACHFNLLSLLFILTESFSVR
jgi:hypothetical protein